MEWNESDKERTFRTKMKNRMKNNFKTLRFPFEVLENTRFFICTHLDVWGAELNLQNMTALQG